MNRERWIETADTLSAEQAELLGSVLEERGGEFGAFPLSFAQQRLWFLDRLSPGQAAYNIAGAIEIRGGLDRAVLRASLREIVRRHEILRTVFVALEGRPLQVVKERIDVPLPVADLTGLPAARRRRERDALARREAQRPFELQRPPLLRALLVTEAAGEHALVLALHHIVSDGWSSRLLARELAALYEAFLAGRPSPLPEPGLQYADFAAWQREWLRGPALERLLAAARPRLAGLPALELPADHRRPAVQSLRGRRLPWVLSGAALAALRGFCEREGVTLFVALSAAFAALLARVTGQRDLALGVPSANRDRVEIEPLIGCFVNLLVLRLDLAAEPGFRELARQARQVALDAVALRDLPFEKLVEELEVGRSLSHAPLVQAMLAFQNDELGLSLPGLELRLADVDNGTAKLDLTLSLVDGGGELRGWLEYGTDLFEASTALRLVKHFGRLLEGALADPERPFSEIPLLSAAEAHQTLREWSDTGAGAGDGCLHELFAAQVARAPEALALVAGEERLTYAELDRRAESVARRLRAVGAGPEALVGVFLERTPWLVAGLLGILKTGAAYVPLDPAYPPERVAYMLADSGAPVVLTQESLAARLPELGIAVVRVDRDEAPGKASRRGRPALPGDLAYVIYTSGSTGRPKGVAVEHRSAVALVRWAWDVFSADLAGVFASTSVCFDLSVFELFVPLSRGGAVILGRDALALADLPGRAEVTLVNTVPSALAEVVRLGALPESVRTVNLAGEPLRRSLVERIAESPRTSPAPRVLNLYGPTEDTTYSTFVQVPPGDAGEPTIGRPVAGTRARLLGPGFAPVPLGVTGELCLAGAGLARGYLGRPGLTAERFVPDAWSEEPGRRLYRTGDLARYLPSGEIGLLGRIDHQVKVRGFRIEPGEIETVLARHPEVARAAVVARDGPAGDRVLVAYVVPRPGAGPLAPELRAHCAGLLPDFMVPARWVELAELPLTANGKLDRRALPDPGAAEGAGTRRYAPPQGAAEETVAAVFSGLLGVSPIGRDDDFFDLGGHSLLATRLVAKLRRLQGAELPLQAVFERRTVRALAAALAGPAEEAIPLLARPREGPEDEPLPLSFAQERLWFLDRFEPGSSQYAIAGGLRLVGRLRPAALARALAGIVARHQALRTRFVERGGTAGQRVEPAVEVPLPVVDLTALPVARRETALARLGRREAMRPFDLARAPLLRVTLARLAPEEHALAVVMHHIVSDGWSLIVLARELAALYGHEVSGEPADLPELPVQYPDYAAWQRAALSPEVRARELGHWCRRLAGVAVLELPADRPRPPVRSGRGETLRVALPAPAARSAAALARSMQASPFHVLMAAFQAVLSRWSGQEDFAVGTPVANRTRSEVGDLVGLFVNTVVLRARPAPARGLRALVREVRAAAVEAMGHQELPLELVVEALAPERDPSRPPLFQVILGFFNEPAVFELPGLAVEPFDLAGGTARLDLTLNLHPRGEALAGMLEASADLFDRATAARLWRHLATLLEAGLAEPERPLAALPLLAAGERHQVTAEWAGLRSAYPRDARLAELFARQARRQPDTVALELDGTALSYGELARRVDRLAARLGRLGVGPEVPVGLLLDRSVEMIVATLAVVAAGGCYAPLDPEYPRRRLEAMLADVGAPVVLAHTHLAARFPGLLDGSAEGYRGTVVALDPQAVRAGGAAAPEGERQAPPPVPPGSESLAYVMFTSGSTGRPKGVAVPQRAVARLVLDPDFARLDEGETLLQLAPTPFDAATLEIWGSLANGGRLVLMPPGPLAFAELGRVLESRRVSTLWLTAGLFHRMVEEELPALAGVRQLLAGGDVLSPVHVRRVLGEHRGVRVINGYGPTENTTFTACHAMASVPEVAAPVPIGRPIADTSVLLLDRRLEPVPTGVPGELYAAGDGLARGYLGRSGATAAVFLPHPGGPGPGARVYRTGDLARWRPDGTIEFLGRLDGQVKLRGFRVELGEVEAALAAHPAVEAAVVVARDEPPGGKRLVAYLVPAAVADAAPPGAAALRAHLAERLPAYMVPAAFVPLDRLPLDANGKVDRRALPEPPAPALPAEPEAARTPAEALVAELFAEVLGVEAVPLTESFFDLGGHSLLAMQLAARVGDAFGVDLPLRLLFERPTVRELTAALDELQRGSLPPLERLPAADRSAGLPLSFAQERLWFLEQLEGPGARYNVPVLLGLEGDLDLPSFAGALAGLVARHETLRTSFATREGDPVQVVAPAAAGPPPVPVVDLGGLPPGAAAAGLRRLARAEARRHFDLGRGPLLRMVLVRRAARSHAALVTLHHVVSDGWSMGVLLRDLGALYRALHAHTRPELPELPVQYADFAAWQRGWLRGEVLAGQLDYWRAALAGLPALELPADRPLPAVRRHRGGTVTVALGPALGTRLRELATRHHATPFMALLAGFQALLARLSGRDDLAVGSPIANRTRPELEGLIGFFVNTLVLRADLTDDPAFGDLLRRTRERSLEAFAHQDLPFERLVAELAPERDLSRSPLFQALFILQNTPFAALELPGLELRPETVETGTAKFDLTMALADAAGGGFTGTLEYDRELFDETTARRLARRYETLLAAAAGAPGLRVSRLPVVPPGERHQVLAEGHGAVPPRRPAATLHEAFVETAARRPGAVALVGRGETVSYGELARRSEWLARRLRTAGVGPEVRVGVCLERTPRLVAALLGVLRAGGAYVPLDPLYPRERLVFMLEDAGCRVLLTESALLDRLPEAALGGAVRVLTIDREERGGGAGEGAATGALTLVDPAGPAGLAYVIYTSGSTGRPKGVAITHGNATALLAWAGAVFGPAELAGVLASTSVCFDLSVFELFLPLSSGGTVILAQDALELPRLAEACRVRLVNTVPSAMGELVRQGAVPSGVSTVNLAGEALPGALVREIYAGGAVERVVNLYGPSEDTTYSTWSVIARGTASPPIGRPVAGTRGYLLDRRGEPAPLGVPAELCLGGAGLARGYLGRPGLTAERFVPDPFGTPGGRLYRTGDLARRRASCELDFVGRVDHQVKVRGFRIELGEIEARLREHPGVSECAVLAAGDRLVACVVGKDLSPEDLRGHLSERVPGPMVPSSWRLLPSLPLSATGKVDRRALAHLAAEPSAAGADFVAPRAGVEEVLAALWAEVLGLERVSAEASFFELGGHSLLATRLMSRVREAFGADLPLRSLFEGPTVAGLARRIEASLGVSRPALPPIRPVPREGDLPLSFAQERVWLFDQLDADGAANNVPAALAFRGRLDAAALARSLGEVVARHETLRTTFAAAAGGPVQRVAPSRPLALPTVDLGALPPARREGEASRLRHAEARRRFRLETGPLLRTTLVHLSEREHELLLTLHHIVSDGWSLGVLVQELAALYEAFSAGRPSPLEPLPIQYGDFCVWQRQWMAGRVFDEQLGYWKRRLGTGSPLLELPTDRPRPPVRSSRGALRSRPLDAAVSGALDGVAAAAGVTRFMVLGAVFSALLHRLTGQDEVRFGTFVANRNQLETERLIGFFVNDLVLSVEVAGRGSFRALLDRVRNVTLEAYAHQDLPFERLLAELQPERSQSHTPLFQVMLVLQNTPMPALELPDLELALLPIANRRSNFDLTLWIEPRDGQVSLQYSLDLFDGTTAERLLDRFLVLLSAALAEPGRAVGDLPLLGEPERYQVTAGWNDTARADLSGGCVHRHFAEQAARTPDAVAVVGRDARLTYGELDRWSDRLARKLATLGAGPERLVGLLAERSPEMIAGLLAVLKAGAAYLPLDPRAPRERLAFVLEDAGARLLLAHEHLARDLDGHGARLVPLDGPGEEWAGPAGPPPAVDERGLAAYAIYTSGSTGRPKGVLVEQGALAAFTREAVERYAIGPGDRVLQFASVSFDASAEEIYPCLTSGATLVLRDDAMLGSPAEFLATCGRWGVTVLDLPTAYWHDLAAGIGEGGVTLPGSVRLVILGGEKALSERVARWLASTAPGARLVNTYGPTEATVVATHQELDAGAVGAGEVPIGRPIANVRAYVVERSLQPAPVGVPGELLLGGAGLARGYLARPGLTAERFVPDPFAAGERLYRTGDLARRLPGGELEFIARVDSQVKLRGYRVELGEIEARLAEHPAVRAAAVLLREDPPGERYLAAYVACDPQAPPAPAELRDFLKERLPEYMIPPSWTLVAELPVTASGKVDTRTLPAPGGRMPELDRELVAPRTGTEEVLAGIWAQVLGRDRVGVHDSFFELGGYSLLATQIIARVREAFGMELPLGALFESGTVAEMAQRIDAASYSEIPPIPPVPRDGELPLSFAQERIWFLGQLDPDLSSYHVPRPTRLLGRLDAAALERAYTGLVRRHEILRTTFPAVDGRPLQVIHPPSAFRLPLVDLSGLPEGARTAELDRLIRASGRRLFDLVRGPLLRVELVRLGAEEHVVIQTEHHLVHDGWAETVLLRDLLELYAAAVAGRPPVLPELTIQFADFAAWQRRWLSGEVLGEQVAYWRGRLAGAPALLELPTDRPRPPVQSFRGDQQESLFPRRVVEPLRSLSRRQNATLFMTMLAAFKVLLCRLSGQEDLVVGTAVANRRRYQSEDLLGMIINTLALRTDLSGDPTFLELLVRVREVCLGAYAHQDMPFEKLVDAVQPERSLSYPPVFQVMFAFHDAPHPPVDVEGLRAQAIRLHNGSTKFDLLTIMAPLPEEQPGDPDAPVMGASFEYASDLFDGPTIARLRRRYTTLLAEIGRDPGRRISELALLDEEERRALALTARPATSFAADRCLHELFAEQARRVPGAAAVTFGGERLSYAELDQASDRLAARLLALGAGPEVVVGLLADRSPGLVVGILGILKAGAAYLPLDPTYPDDRLRYMLGDSGSTLLVSSAELAGRAAHLAVSPEAGGRDAVLVPLEETAPAGSEPSSPVLPGGRPVLPEHPAYVIYTSGSTGRPKGVVVCHAHVVRLFAATRDRFGFDETDVWTLFHSAAFDFSVWELWGALLHGGRLVVVPYLASRSPEDFYRLLGRERVTVLNQTPSAFRQLVRAEETVGAAPGLALRWVVFGGEALEPPALAPWLDRHGDRTPRLVNMYGITETTVHVTYREVGRADLAPGVGTPIGAPIPDLSVVLRQRGGGLAPLGVPGEMLVGGSGLARGYLGRPGLTAERFVPDPWSGEPGARLYRSGDLGRLCADGDLEYLGRIDHQVKVRGFRIELGEIEAALAACPGVSESTVVADRDALGEARLVAYVVGTGETAPAAAALRDELRRRLPAHMVPAQFVPLAALPLNANGKVDRRALPAPEAQRRGGDGPRRAPRSEVERAIAEVWRDLLGLEEVDLDTSFFDLGGHSLLLVRAHSRLRQALSRELQVVDLFRYPTVASLARFLSDEPAPVPPPRAAPDAAAVGREIAIIGMACRVPGARDVEELWANLCDGVESISRFSDAELLAAGVDAEVLRDPRYVKAKGILEDIEGFDAALFGFTPREAEITDPQHRLFLECAWEALERAGYDSTRYPGAVGVYAGVAMNAYWLNLAANPAVLAATGGFQARLSNDKDFLPTRVSYKLNLRGPSVNVQTACSTSLVAVHLACRSLLEGECDMALAGGVTAAAQQRSGYLYAEGGIHSPDGRCRAFDAEARGTVGGNGLGIVVLKRLADALADGDHVHAVIRGSAINNDGAGKVGYTAPSVAGQAEVIARAQARAGVAPETVAYIEAHGTGTALGDPIEIAALTEVFRAGTTRRGFCAVGSVKTNVGHLDAAAGVTGLIKAALAVERATIPPSLNFETPNPGIDFAASPFYVATELAPWPPGDGPRRAGVSAFGVGGTNAHVVLEQAPAPEAAAPSRPWQLLVWSAATAGALEASTDRLSHHLGEHPELELADVAWTLQVGRRRLRHRRFLVCRDTADAVQALDSRDPRRLFHGAEERAERSVAFLFPGLGDQHVDMGRELYEAEPTFRAELDRACELLTAHVGVDLRRVMYPERREAPGKGRAAAGPDLRRLLGRGGEPAAGGSARLERTLYAQPAVFALEHALARLWMEWGVQPEAMLGYSLGEYTAACLAGVMRFEDALWLVAERARLIDELPAGAMLAVALPEEEVLPLLGDSLSLAATHTPAVSVVAGGEEEIEALERRLAETDVVARRLRTGHAFHSPHMAPVAGRFAERLRRISLQPPRIPFLSNVTGTWITAEQATDPEYWTRHLCSTVRFAEGVGELLSEAGRVLLEVGPGQALGPAVRQHPARSEDHLVLSSLRDELDREPETTAMLTALGRLWLAGAQVDWSGLARREKRRRVVLPTYPFERQRYWIEARPMGPSAADRAAARKPDPADWFYVPTWKPSPPPSAPGLAASTTPWLVFLDEGGLGRRLVERLRLERQDVAVVRAGGPFGEIPGEGWSLDPRRALDYDRLLRTLRERGRVPRRIVHLWSLGEPRSFEEAQELGFHSLLSLARALAHEGIADPARLTVVSSGVQRVDGREDLRPEKSTLLGPLLVIQQEYRNLTCVSVDVVPPEPGSRWEAVLVDRLLGELAAERPDRVLAYRRGCRWVQDVEAVPLEPARPPQAAPRPGGVYLLTGGLGRIGLTLARHLAATARARLVLTGRSELPDRRDWPEWLAAHGDEDAVSRRLRAIQELEALGAEVLVLRADAADRRQMATVVRETLARFGALHGVVHLAGVIERHPIEDTDPENVRRIFRSKVEAARVLEEVLDGLDLDFCLLFSSIASVLGGLGYAAYAAANVYLDAFTTRHNATAGTPWLSVGWGGTRQAEWEGEPAILVGTSLAELAMTPEETADAFDRLLSSSTSSQIVVSTADLRARIDRWVRFETPADEPRDEGASAAVRPHTRPRLQTTYVAPGDDAERAVVRLWQELLGIDQVGVHDDFFELGGDSLLATRLLSALRREFRLEVSFRSLFEARTPAAQAGVLRRLQEEQRAGKPVDVPLLARRGQSIAEQLEELTRLSDDEVESEALGGATSLPPAAESAS